MAKKMKNLVRDNPMLIETDRGMEDVVDLLTRGVRTVQIKVSENRFHPVKVEDIPISVYHLGCGCSGRGIAVQEGNVLFCATHSDHQSVVGVRQ